MNDDFSVLRAAAIERAAGVIEAARLRVLDRGCARRMHQLDLAAPRGSDILAAVEVRPVPASAVGGCVMTLTEDRFWQKTDAVRAWMREREASYQDLRVVMLAVAPGSGRQVALGTAAGVLTWVPA